ncbi:MAG: GAF domain-containing protein [Anaerolineae bacterium]|nr:GAF domain-containing protein [Anaerolineae bacterium]
MQASPYSHRVRDHLPGILATAAALLVAGVLLIGYADAAYEWTRQPFMGFLPSRTLEVTDAGPLTDVEWPVLRAGLVSGDRLTKLGDVALGDLPPEERLEAFNEALLSYDVGDTVAFRFERDDAVSAATPPGAFCVESDGPGLRQCDLTVELIDMPSGDMISYFVAGWTAAAVLWLIAVMLLVRRGNSPLVRHIVLVSAAVSVYLGGAFDAISTYQLVLPWLAATCLAGGLSVVFALEFPYHFAAVQRTPALLWAPAVVAAVMGGVGVMFYFSSNTGLSDKSGTFVEGMLVLGVLILAGTMIWRRSRSVSPVARNQSTVVLIGVLPALLASIAWIGWELISGEMVSSSLQIFYRVLPVLFPLSVMYAISQFRLVDTDRLITQSTLYGLLLGLLVLSYWLAVAGIALLIGSSTRETALSPVLIAVSILVIATLFMPLRTFLQHQIEAAYFRARRVYQRYLERFSREITNAVTLKDVVALVQHYLDDTLAPVHIMVFVRDNVTHEYRCEPDPENGQRATDIIFSEDSGLVRYLRDQASLLYLEEGSPLPLDVVSDRARLAVLGAPVIVRLRGQRVLNGFVAIGPRQSGAAYVHEDLRFIEGLGDQVALAVERAQVVDDLARRVRVQDVLSQVSRALNFAIDFDTLLELVYAQISRVIDVPNFYIALRLPNMDELSYVFYNEGDERIASMEGQRWRIGRDLMSEIARTRQTIRTDDYVRETLTRDPNARLDNSNLKAWMGVPLLADAGGGVLGVMVAATTEPGINFTDEQQELFWDIANLAASAIDRLQLFDKMQQRARQLSAINEIASQMSAEMGDVDRLLQMITESAVQILGAEAGSLLLVDAETGDLEFHAVVGGGGQELIGTRIPAGSGLVGAAAQRRAPIIVNDPTRDSRWYGDVHSEDGEHAVPVEKSSGDGFRSTAILSVPLLAQGRAIGVLQTLNKTDGGIYVQDDADLLETFAGQAAIAIENARLFDMTDQQLALRVQELDTMQRIDQELNRTLNFDKVVDITMDWALRKSGASAGALLMIDREEDDPQVIASYGYAEGPLLTGQVYPRNRGTVGRLVRSGQPSLITDVSIDPDYVESFPGCVAQLIVPLFSANRVIGVIILESERDGELGLLDLDFVARLAEHASPAIVNSQLFEELERANQAKSEFVSFVAHELKNPMTSMKGYTDLLLKGVVGPVNEQQSDFLSTIFKNVGRMETLVSDLNDLTKQETNNLRLEIFPVDFRMIMMETLRTHQRQIEEKSQELVIEIPQDLPLVMGDQNRLIQVITNFISNANKYTQPGGMITICAEVTRNTWDPQGAPEVVHCYVADNGIGMTGEDLDQLFTPYFRSDNPKTREQPGTGLGLTITRGLIELHGGRVWVESALGTGSTFHFTIPVASEEMQVEYSASGSS